MARADMEQALTAFPELAELAGEMIAGLHAGSPASFVDATLHVIEGDARHTLPAWEGRADAWYLDGFSPAKNPELWGTDLMAEVARHTNPHGTAATYTAAGFVRRGLADAGFDVTRAPGYGRKRHMTRAALR